VLAVALLAGLAVSIALKLWWQFLLLFFGAVFLRAVLTRKLVRLSSVFYNLLIGFYSIWEFLRVPARAASSYSRDFEEVKANQGQHEA